jgi:hypothetical protein
MQKNLETARKKSEEIRKKTGRAKHAGGSGAD